MTALCHYCSGQLASSPAPFCAPCRSAAAVELKKAELAIAALSSTGGQTKATVSCYACKKLFTHKTVAAHAGFCGRCSTVSSISTDTQHASINNQLARVVWQHYMTDGKIEQLCYCCNEQRINVWSYQCGHVHAAAKGGPTTVDNLRPICSACNQGMGTQNMHEFAVTNGFHGRLRSETTKVDDMPALAALLVTDNKYKGIVVVPDIAELQPTETTRKHKHQCALM